MESKRPGNTKVYTLKVELNQIKAKLGKLYVFTGNPIYRMKKEDIENFLKLVAAPPYSNVTTVGQLMKIIMSKRAELKTKLNELGDRMPGYQFSIFDDPKVVSPLEQAMLDREKDLLEKEIHWLHKCLGICRNKNYFKAFIE